MKVLFAASDKAREGLLAEAFIEGVRGHGDEGVVCHNGAPPAFDQFDAVCMVGVKSREIFTKVKAAGAVPIMLDKGYVRTRRAGNRTWEFWRVSAHEHHPTSRLMGHSYPADRFESLGLELVKWRKSGLQILFAGSSGKYHEFYGLPDPTLYAQRIVDRLATMTDRPIVYRPKPSWREAVPIPGTRFSVGGEGITGALANAHCLVTHGSNACFEAALMGIPSIVLGDAVAQPISSTTIADIESPLCGKRWQWFCNLAYRQWTEDEMRSGQAWETIRGWI